MTRQEHLDWCKKRALEYVDAGEFVNAITSIGSDLAKHPETANHPGIDMGFGLMMVGALSTDRECRRFIEGFH